MPAFHRPILCAIAVIATAACAADAGVATQRAQRTPETTSSEPIDTESSTAPPATTPPTPRPPPATPTTDPAAPATTVPAPPSDDDVLDIGDAKPARAYDEFLVAALADLQRWWTTIYPELYGEPFEPLAGGVYAAYPRRTDPIPGCGDADETTYREVNEFAAFYCRDGDFMVYDDGVDGLLGILAGEYGPSILGVVLAHEFAHAVQARTGGLDARLPTVLTEQQADCFAGSWVARANRGEAPGVTFGDEDVRGGLIAMITVRDPVGTDQFSAGGHGSAFDRVGAFQVGFDEGPRRCTGLLESPLPLVPNAFVPGSEDELREGNLPFGYADGEIVRLVVTDLNVYWPETVTTEGGELDSLTVVPIESGAAVECAELAGDLATGAAVCPDTGEVFLDEPRAVDLHREFGDFSVGYVLGTAWAEAVQIALGSPLAGEPRALASDCLVGAWTATLIPGSAGRTERGAQISPGDLDEVIRTALVIGDARQTDDLLGSGFEKIASYRAGVLGRFGACATMLAG